MLGRWEGVLWESTLHCADLEGTSLSEGAREGALGVYFRSFIMKSAIKSLKDGKSQHPSQRTLTTISYS